MDFVDRRAITFQWENTHLEVIDGYTYNFTAFFKLGDLILKLRYKMCLCLNVYVSSSGKKYGRRSRQSI